MSSRLTIAVHILSRMALGERNGTPKVTSEGIAASVRTNPVVIRRALRDLRNAGLVTAQRGNGAGFCLARPPEDITLAQVHDAVEDRSPFALHANPPSDLCPVGRGIGPALRRIYGGVDEALHAELARTTVAEILAQSLQHSRR